MPELNERREARILDAHTPRQNNESGYYPGEQFEENDLDSLWAAMRELSQGSEPELEWREDLGRFVLAGKDTLPIRRIGVGSVHYHLLLRLTRAEVELAETKADLDKDRATLKIWRETFRGEAYEPALKMLGIWVEPEQEDDHAE